MPDVVTSVTSCEPGSHAPAGWGQDCTVQPVPPPPPRLTRPCGGTVQYGSAAGTVPSVRRGADGVDCAATPLDGRQNPRYQSGCHQAE
eukprot:366030-Chlamydomonas_euryale.AAC.13